MLCRGRHIGSADISARHKSRFVLHSVAFCCAGDHRVMDLGSVAGLWGIGCLDVEQVVWVVKQNSSSIEESILPQQAHAGT